MKYERIKLKQEMYNIQGGLSNYLEQIDPSQSYTGTVLESLDAFQRQLKRFDIKVSGSSCNVIEKFFVEHQSTILFPEYVRRAIIQGYNEANMVRRILATVTNIDHHSYIPVDIINDSTDPEFRETYGILVPETVINPSDRIIRLKERYRMLNSEYDDIRSQKINVVTTILKQIGTYFAKEEFRDAVHTLAYGDNENVPAADKLNFSESFTYTDFLELWATFDDFELNVLLVSPDIILELLEIEELDKVAGDIYFGSMSNKIEIIKSTTVPFGTIVALDKNYALEMITRGEISVQHDKLINLQFEPEKVAIINTVGFNKIFPDAVRIMKRS